MHNIMLSFASSNAVTFQGTAGYLFTIAVSNHYFMAIAKRTISTSSSVMQNM